MNKMYQNVREQCEGYPALGGARLGFFVCCLAAKSSGEGC